MNSIKLENNKMILEKRNFIYVYINELNNNDYLKINKI